MNHLHVVMDESGSMQSMSTTIYAGARELVDDVAENGTVCITRFNSNVFTGTDESPTHAKEHMVPRECNGSTALYDAICSAINQTLTNHPDAGNLTIAIVTDGVENSSSKTLGEVRSFISQAHAKNWRVVFLGSNQDAVMTAQTMGIRPGRAMTYGNNESGARSAFRSLGEAQRRYNSGNDEAFTAPERQASIGSYHVYDAQHKWLSVDPRTGDVVPYNTDISRRLETAFDNNEHCVVIDEWNATVFLDRDGKHMQKTASGERDVRRAEIGSTIYIRNLRQNGFRICDNGVETQIL